jgi:cystathionine beta-lyase
MKYDFDKIIERANTNSVKYDFRNTLFGTNDVIPMWVADMDFETPDFIKKAVRKRADEEVFGYTFRGDSYAEAICQWQERHHQWDVNKSQILFSPGVVPGLALAVLSFTKPGDKIIIQSPVYTPFFSTVKDNNRELVINELVNTDGHYTMDFERLESQIDDKTAMIILSNPHNPVGRAWSKEELEKLVDICEAKNILIVSDEIHSDLVFNPHKHIPLASISEKAKHRTITFMAASKTFNIAGLSTAYVIIQNRGIRKQFDQALEAYHLFLGNIFGNVATEAAYREGEEWMSQMKSYIESNMDFVIDYLNKHLPQIKCKKPEATYLMWLDFRNLKMGDDSLNQFLIEKAGLGLNRGDSFGEAGSGFMRLNVACPRATVEKAMEQLKEAISKM